MAPWVQPGDRVLIDTGCGAESAKPGMIGCFRTPRGRFVMHRILLAEEAGLLSKGDNHPRIDPSWEPRQLEGIVVAVQRGASGRWIEETDLGQRIGLRLSFFRPARLAYFIRWLLSPFCLNASHGRPRRRKIGKPIVSAATPTPCDRQWIGRELVVYDEQTDAIHVLNETAVRILTLHEKGQDESEIAKGLSVDYPEVPLDELRHDVQAILVTFSSLRLSAVRDPHDP